MSQVSESASNGELVGSARSRPAGLPVNRWLRGFGMFWWDFFVGDTPELFVGVVAALAIVYGIASYGTSRWIESITTVILASGVIAISVARAVRSSRRSGG